MKAKRNTIRYANRIILRLNNLIIFLESGLLESKSKEKDMVFLKDRIRELASLNLLMRELLKQVDELEEKIRKRASEIEFEYLKLLDEIFKD